jgi:hypothetical protein
MERRAVRGCFAYGLLLRPPRSVASAFPHTCNPLKIDKRFYHHSPDAAGNHVFRAS